MNLERGFRRTTVVVSVGLLVASLGLAALIGPDAARSAERAAARAVLVAGHGGFRDASYEIQDGFLNRVLRGETFHETPAALKKGFTADEFLALMSAEEIAGIVKGDGNFTIEEAHRKLETLLVTKLIPEARRAARLARAQSWAAWAAVVLVVTLLPWGAFLVLRWIVRGFSGDQHSS